MKRINEGFFQNASAQGAHHSTLDMQKRKDELTERLMGGMPLTNDDWDFVDDFMDACVPVRKNNDLYRLCSRSINAYGAEVHLNWIDTSGIKNMSGLFQRGLSEPKFNGDVSRWDTSSVTDMSDMFRGCDNFNGDVSRWDTSNVTDMCGMFYNCRKFNGDVSRWDTSKVKNMSGMFSGCKELSINLSSWDTSSVTNMGGMFWGCEKFNGDVSGWDVSRVNNMREMFTYCELFNGDVSGWNVKNVVCMISMFEDCSNFDQDLGGWNTSKLCSAINMFCGCTSFRGEGLENWDTQSLLTIEDMFKGCTSLSNSIDFSRWNLASLRENASHQMFDEGSRYRVEHKYYITAEPEKPKGEFRKKQR